MKRKYGLVCLMLALALLCATALAAGAASDIRLNQVQQNKDTLTMYVSMLDGSGTPIRGNYTADEFTVQIDSATFPADSVTAFDPNTMGINYMLCIDVSKSLTKDMMANVHAGIDAFVDGLGPKDTVSVLTFGSTVEEKTRMNSNRDEIKAIIDAIEPTDMNTALYKGVLDAVDIASRISGRSTVVVITDGANDVETADDSVKGYTKDNIFDSVTAAQVPLYGVGLTDKDVDRESLKELADATGGSQFFAPAAEIGTSMNMIQEIMRSTYMLTVHPINTTGRSGFQELTTFVVGYEPDDAPFVSSNKLQQEINWSSIPAPVYTPEPTEVPEIGLELDDTQITFRNEGDVTITGVIEVQHGSVTQDELSIVVNGERWRTELNPNGSDYIFRAEGRISASTTELDVSAAIQGTGITSRHRTIGIATPTPAATSTPKPSLTLTLDATDQSLLYEVGRTITVTGVVEAKSSPVNVDELVLFFNDIACEAQDVQFSDIGANQYEFTAYYTIQPGSSTTIDVSVQLNGSDISSRKQRIYVPTPAPTPEPQLTLILDETSILLSDDGNVTISGTIETTGAVDANDLAVYVEGTLWRDTAIEQRDDGNFHFDATGQLSGGVTGVNVRASLNSVPSIRSSSERVELYTPVPTATVAPTARPTLTPEPSATPTASPTPTAEPTSTPDVSVMGKITGVYNSLRDSGRLWIVLAGAGVLLLLIIALIVLLILRAKKNKTPQPTGFDTSARHYDVNASGTVRPDMTDNGQATIGPDGNPLSSSDYMDEPQRRPISDTIDLDNPGNGTIIMGRDVESGGTIMSLGDEPSSVRPPYDDMNGFDEEPGGTQRIMEDFDEGEEEPGGTQRIEDEEFESVPVLDIRMEETYKREQREDREFEMMREDSKVMGRKSPADIVIDDSTISTRHCRLYFDGESLFVEDLGSTNGTKVNDERDKLEPGEMRRLSDGDSLHMGKTVLTLRFGEPRMG